MMSLPFFKNPFVFFKRALQIKNTPKHLKRTKASGISDTQQPSPCDDVVVINLPLRVAGRLPVGRQDDGFWFWRRGRRQVQEIICHNHFRLKKTHAHENSFSSFIFAQADKEEPDVKAKMKRFLFSVQVGLRLLLCAHPLNRYFM